MPSVRNTEEGWAGAKQRLGVILVGMLASPRACWKESEHVLYEKPAQQGAPAEINSLCGYHICEG